MQGVTLRQLRPRGHILVSIHTPHAGSDYDLPAARRNDGVSIHTPHAGSDPAIYDHTDQLQPVSIHTPHAGSDKTKEQQVWIDLQFQSTLPMQGVTREIACLPHHFVVSIHTPHAGSDSVLPARRRGGWSVSIHTPHAGSDTMSLETVSGYTWFQSTLPMQGVTRESR